MYLGFFESAILDNYYHPSGIDTYPSKIDYLKSDDTADSDKESVYELFRLPQVQRIIQKSRGRKRSH